MSIASLTTYLINLDTSIERRLSAEQYLKSAGLEFTRVPAFDGRGANPKDFAEYDHHRARGWFGRGLSGAELGCYFSHVACVRRFLQSDAAFGLVLEDDLALEPSAADILRSSLDFLETPRAAGWYVVNFGKPIKRLDSPVATLKDASGTPYVLSRSHYFPDTTTALLWSRDGAQAFLDELPTIYAPIDHMLRHWNMTHDQGYAFRTSPITTTGAVSDIQTAPGGKECLPDASETAESVTTNGALSGDIGITETQTPAPNQTTKAPFYQLRKQRRLWSNKHAAKRNKSRFDAGLTS